MGNSLRCCLACMIPCGALDVVRIVHLNGHVEEYSRQVFAGEILTANPNHVISKPCSHSAARRIMILSPESELERGCIYFLIPLKSVPEKKKRKQKKVPPTMAATTTNSTTAITSTTATQAIKVQDRDRYLSDILAEKRSSQQGRRRSGRVGVWRPHLAIIAEEP